MTAQYQFRVLDESATREEFAKAAGQLGLRRHAVLRDGEEGYEDVWSNAAETSAVNYVEDPDLDLRYVSVRGADSAKLLVDLPRKLAIFDPEELIEIAYSADEDPEELNTNLLRLAVTYPEYDRRVEFVFQNYATTAPDPELRMTALDAIGLYAWEQLRPVVQQVANNDQNGAVRDYAKRVLERWAATRDE
ncbi:MAG: hypothetical protein IIZ38_19635 [Sphingomonas sp.]|uniref:hypothetical protein n=1 Tax=Sphingomonas sp. TaxID=28214 RepID=UPI0025EEF746|nr:hypothetical protein [Sphingomonas sp.]MBQ1500524.1 hypothetical protein [Sphingomonas sp.]